jgi:flagellar M-ring protein FliF
VEKSLKQLEAFLRNLSLQQKLLLGVSAILVLAVAGLFVRLTQTADFKPLYTGLSPQDAQSVGQRLAAKNIRYEISTDGTSVRVPADELDKVRLDLAAEGMPQSGRLGFELFDKPNWAGSDFSEQVNYQRALEGELERTIQTLGNVESVRVHLVLPHDSLFSDRERVAKAAVVMKLRGGGLSDDQVNAVTRLVASAVDNLSPDNVTLIGADGRTPLVAKGRDGVRGLGAVELEASMAEKLVATLAPVVGPDHVKASVTVAYDQSSGDTTEETYDPDNPVLLSSQVQEEHFGGNAPAGIPGTPSNVPGAAPVQPPAAQPPAKTPPAAAGTNAQPAPAPAQSVVSLASDSGGQRSETKTFAVSKTLKHLTAPSGRVQRIAAAVLVDDVIDVTEEKGERKETRRKRTPEEMKQIEDAAKAAIGFDATRGDLLSVQNISFLSAPFEKPLPTPKIDRIRVTAEKWLWLARYVLLLTLFLLIYALVLRPVKNQLVKSFLLGASAGAANRALASGTAELESGAFSTEGAHSISDADLESELNATSSDVQRVVRLKKHLADKVKREPAAASQLVRQWIHEGERR